MPFGMSNEWYEETLMCYSLPFISLLKKCNYRFFLYGKEANVSFLVIKNKNFIAFCNYCHGIT